MFIGIFGVVYFVVGFVYDVCMYGVYIIEINLELSVVESEFVEKCYGKVSIEVLRLVEEILVV